MSHNRTVEVRPGRISKTFELDYNYDVKGVIRRGRCEGDDTKLLFGVLVIGCVVSFESLLSDIVIENHD